MWKDTEVHHNQWVA